MHAAVHGYVKESTQRIEAVEAGKSVTYAVVGGDLSEMYDPYRVTLRFVPVGGREGEECVAGWEAEYEPRNPAVPPPERARDVVLSFLKSFEAFGPISPCAKCSTGL